MNLTARVDAYLTARPNRWIDARRLLKVGGFGGWRTRISECRTQLGRQIDNRTRKVKGYTVSEYRLVTK